MTSHLSINKKKMLANLQTEVDASYLYKLISELEPDKEIASYYLQMSIIEGAHVKKGIERANELNISISLPIKPSWRARVIGKIGKSIGYNFILSTLIDTEKGISQAVVKKKITEGKKIAGNETRHVQILKSISSLQIGKLSKIEGKHRSIGGNALRAAVLGANDGLVSNLCLVMGVAGASSNTHSIIIAGIAGLLAGALSMALGEWISVKSSQELYERQMEIEMEEIENNPEEEKQELILLYKAKGFSEQEAHAMADKAFQDTDHVHDILLKEELGVGADDLKGSAWEAAIASFVFFVLGAIIPVIPYFFFSQNKSFIISIAFSIVGLFLMGTSITLFTGKSIWKSGFRQVLFGLAAAAATFGIGKLVGQIIL